MTRKEEINLFLKDHNIPITSLEAKSIIKGIKQAGNKILAFPTAEMRDAFFEDFKELIEQCKELL